MAIWTAMSMGRMTPLLAIVVTAAMLGVTAKKKKKKKKKKASIVKQMTAMRKISQTFLMRWLRICPRALIKEAPTDDHTQEAATLILKALQPSNLCMAPTEKEIKPSRLRMASVGTGCGAASKGFMPTTGGPVDTSCFSIVGQWTR
jgi:hypothetical protein